MIGHFTKVREGRTYLIQVADVSQAPLPDTELAILMNWVLQEFSAEQITANFIPYNAKEIEKFRTNRPADLHSTRRKVVALLEQLGIELPPYVRP